MDIISSLPHNLLLKIPHKDNDIQILDSTEDFMNPQIVDSLRISSPLGTISENSSFCRVLKNKIKRAYIVQGEGESTASSLVRDCFFDAWMNIQDQHHSQAQYNLERAQSQKEEETIKHHADMVKGSKRFCEYLEEHNATVLDFLDYISAWLLVNEVKNIQTAFFAHLSTISGLKPVWTIFLGESGKGKSAIEIASFSLLPRKMRVNGRSTYASILSQTLERGEQFLDKKVISLGDLGGENSYTQWVTSLDVFKELSTEGYYEYTKMSDEIDKETKSRTVVNLTVEGYPSVSFSSTHSKGLTDQYLSRGITLTPRADDDDVSNFRTNTAHATYSSEFQTHLKNQILPLFHSYIEVLLDSLTSFKVINPYYYCLENWFKESGNFKRSSEMFPALVSAVTLLNYKKRHVIYKEHPQFPYTQKEEEDTVEVGYYVATKEDNQVVANLYHAPGNLTADTLAFYDKLKETIGPYDPQEYEEYTEGYLPIRNTKTIFTISELKNRHFKRVGSEEKLKFASFCQKLYSEGYLVLLGHNSRGHNIYGINEMQNVVSRDISYDSEMIRKYIDEVILDQNWGMGISEEEIMKCMLNEAPSWSVKNTLEYPPWHKS